MDTKSRSVTVNCTLPFDTLPQCAVKDIAKSTVVPEDIKL